MNMWEKQNQKRSQRHYTRWKKITDRKKLLVVLNFRVGEANKYNNAVNKRTNQNIIIEKLKQTFPKLLTRMGKIKVFRKMQVSLSLSFP